jgi:hypothetical protein
MWSLGQSDMNKLILSISCDSIDKRWIDRFQINKTFVKQLTNKLKHKMEKEHKMQVCNAH